ncbi:MAG: MFS transporter, partial [Anaerolineaceae bacterium]|nr:MFS transporter [Anaerolineaceae bacterium]
GIYTLVFMGIMPIGALMFGFLADSVGSPVTLWITSGLLLTFGVVVWFAIPKLRQLK